MPSRRLAPSLSAAALLATLAASIAAQAVPSVNLGKPAAKSKYTLGRLFSMQELADGRVIASDTKEQIFRLVDLNKGNVDVVGNQGDDADSYKAASVVLRMQGDSLGLYDPASRRLMEVTPQGNVARFIPMPARSNNRPIGTPLAADQNGSLHFTLPEQFDTVTKSLTGSAGITRFAPGADADEPQMTYRTRRADQTALKGRMPYVFRDAVAIRSDGLMARVVSDSYQVVWGRNGRETGRTGLIAYSPIPLTPEEIKATKDSANEMMKTMLASSGRGTSFSSGGSAVASSGMAMGGGGERTIVMIGGGGAGGSAPVVVSGGGDAAFVRGMVAGAEAKAAGEARGAGGDVKVMNGASINPADIPWGDFPDAKPPIPASGTVAMFDGNGNLWVARTGKVGDAVPHYDVIAEGKGLIGHVNLPSGTRLLGFGKNAVYVARAEDGSDWLERYALPKM